MAGATFAEVAAAATARAGGSPGFAVVSIRIDVDRRGVGKYWSTNKALQSSNQQTIKNLSGLVAVSDILEGLSGIGAADIEEDFLSTSVVSLALVPLKVLHLTAPMAE